MKLKKSSTEVCKICNGIIHLESDNYCHIEDFFKGEYTGDGWYHLKCFDDKIKGKYSENMLKKAMEYMGLKPKEQVVEV